jgi:ABC-type branched-subunit amino acid transport system substrate-binding protein
MKKKRIIPIGLGLLGLASHVPAEVPYPSFSWTTGKLHIPIVDVQPSGTFDVNMDWLTENQEPMIFVLQDIKDASATTPVSATFSTENNTLHVPAVEVSSGSEGLVHYKAVFSMTPNTKPLQFVLTNAALLGPLKIGGLFPLSGIGSEFYREKPHNGALLAIKHLTEAGFEVEMHSKDSGMNSTDGVAAARQLVDEHNVQVLVGGAFNEMPTAVTEQITIPNQVLQIAYGSSASVITELPVDKDQDLLFRTSVSDAAYGIVLAKAAYDQGYRKLAIFYVELNQGLSDVFQENFENWGGKIVAAIPLSIEVATSYQKELKQAAQEGAEALVVLSYPEHTSVYMKEALVGGFFNKFLAMVTTQSKTILEQMVGVAIPDGSCAAAPSFVSTDSRDKFNASYQAEYGESSPQLFSENAYDAVIVATLAAWAAKKNGEVITPVSIRNHLREVAGPPGEQIEPSIEDLKRARERLQAGKPINYTGASGNVNFDENGDVLAPLDIVCSQDGIAVTQATLMPNNFEVVGVAGMFFHGTEEIIRYQESALGNLVADVMLEAAKSEGAVAALTNTGILRTSIGEGEVTLAELLMTLPLGNTLVVLEVTGRELVAALDHGLTHAGGETTGAFPNIAGMQVNYCDHKACSDALLEGGVVTSLSIEGTAVDMDKTYQIATHDFLVGGGDGYTMLEEACQRGNCRKTSTLLVDLVADEFRTHSPVTREIGPRINPISNVKLGGVFPLRGSWSEFGKSFLQSAKLAIKHLGKAGYPVTLVVADSKTDPTVGVSASRPLIETWDVAALIASATSGVTIPIAEQVAIPNQVPQMGYAATSPKITDLEADIGHDFLFRTAVSDTTQGLVLASMAYDAGYRQVSILYIDDPYGRGLMAVFTENFEKLGGSVVASVPHEDKTTSYQSELSQAVEGGEPEALIAISFPAQIGVYLPQAFKKGFFEKFLFVDASKSEKLIEVVGADVLEGMCGTGPGAAETASLLNFNASYEAEYGESPSTAPFLPNAYDAVIIEALAAYAAQVQNGSITPVGLREQLRDVAGQPGEKINASPEDLKRAFELLQAGKPINYEGASGNVDFDDKGEVMGPTEIWCYEGGKIVSKDLVSPNSPQ